MSATASPAPPTLQSILGAADTLLKSQLAAAVQVEAKTVLTPFVTFFNWVAANPGAATNPVTALPQVVLLQSAVLAAQSNANSDDITSVAGALSSSLSAFISAA
jgi:hypothetical protein